MVSDAERYSGVPSGAEPQKKGMKSLGAMVAGGNTAGAYSDGIDMLVIGDSQCRRL